MSRARTSPRPGSVFCGRHEWASCARSCHRPQFRRTRPALATMPCKRQLRRPEGTQSGVQQCHGLSLLGSFFFCFWFFSPLFFLLSLHRGAGKWPHGTEKDVWLHPPPFWTLVRSFQVEPPYGHCEREGKVGWRWGPRESPALAHHGRQHASLWRCLQPIQVLLSDCKHEGTISARRARQPCPERVGRAPRRRDGAGIPDSSTATL